MGFFFSALFTLMVYLIMLAMFLVLMSNAYAYIMDQDMRTVSGAPTVVLLTLCSLQILIQSQMEDKKALTFDQIVKEAWGTFYKRVRLWWSMCMLCDFSELDQTQLPDSLEVPSPADGAPHSILTRLSALTSFRLMKMRLQLLHSMT